MNEENYKGQLIEDKDNNKKNSIVEKTGIGSPEYENEKDVIKILRTATGPMDAIDMSEYRTFSNCKGIPIDMPDEEFIEPSGCQRNLSYRF